MKCQITKTIKQHLEYLGYEIEDLTKKQEKTDLIIALHPRRSNLLININEDEIIYIKALYKEFSDFCYEDMVSQVNETNKNSILTKWQVLYTGADHEVLTISIAACQIGYDKNKFTDFLDLFDAEITEYMPEYDAYTLPNNQVLLPQLSK